LQKAAAPTQIGIQLISTVPIDELLDNHAVELEECRRWASSDAGQMARVQNPAGFANVRAHAAEHAAALARLAAGGSPVILSPAKNLSSPSSGTHTKRRASAPPAPPQIPHDQHICSFAATAGSAPDSSQIAARSDTTHTN